MSARFLLITSIRPSFVYSRLNLGIPLRLLLTSSLFLLVGMLLLVCTIMQLVLSIANSHKDTYRPPYYHRNAASELMGLIYGGYGGRSDAFQPGSVSFECGSTSRLFPICHESVLTIRQWFLMVLPTKNSKKPPPTRHP